tara:strand:- start:254 stop:706 length:453 start_codon:yes stop_codon:yes gene_type:complete
MNIKKTLLIIVLNLIWCNFSISSSMISIQEYVKSNPDYSKDPIKKTHVLKRCAAAYIYVSVTTQDNNSEKKESYAIASDKVMKIADEILINEMNWSPEKAAKSIVTDIDNNLENYIKDGKDSSSDKGENNKSNYIDQDIQFCKSVVDNKL